MPQFERVKDPWRELRKDLYGNVEPTVELEAITMPLVNNFGDYLPKAIPEESINHYDVEPNVDFSVIEELPAISAGVSYGAKDKLESDHERAIKLNKKLVEMGHHTPLEAIQFNFFVSGISKACGAQISRHRCGQGHVSASRRFQEADPKFVYPVLDYISDEEEIKLRYGMLAHSYKHLYTEYQRLRSDKIWWWEGVMITGDTPDPPSKYKEFAALPLHKEDARMVLPVSYATERTWWINVRGLRDFFRLRLAADAEWEIRRLAWMIFDMVEPLLPSLFEDLRPERIRYSSPSKARIIEAYRARRERVVKEFTKEEFFDLEYPKPLDKDPSCNG